MAQYILHNVDLTFTTKESTNAWKSMNNSTNLNLLSAKRQTDRIISAYQCR